MKKFFRLLSALWIVAQIYSCKTTFVFTPFCDSLATYYVPVIKQSGYDPVTRTLSVSWDNVPCAQQYQLEWTFAGLEDSSTLDAAWKPDFRFNSTRIVTHALHYDIPVIFDEGTLVYRIRCVKMNNTHNQALFSAWSQVFNSGQSAGLGNLRPAAIFKINNALAHEDHKLNWQYSTTYTEQGWRKDEIQYLDGTLRQRQVVTLSNSDTVAIAINTIYDNQGRPAISTLPAPVIHADSIRSDNQYAHHLGYFPKQVLAARDTAYSYRQFDVDRFVVKTDSCSPGVLKPRPISTESGVSRYFSTNNRDKSGLQGYVPDAGGFPYTQTQWTDDNTNRIVRKSSPGAMHYVGSNHELSFRYADVAQDEIDMLFGNDAGNESFYKKVIKVDPNGQMSIEYSKVDGKVVATALAGPVPGNVDSIASQVVPINVDIVGTEQTAGADELSKFSTKTFDLSINAACAFGYRLLPRNFEKNLCNNEKVCLDCRYKVQLSIRDASGAILHQVDTSIGTLQQNCATGNGPVYRSLFTKILCKGSYTVTRTLTIDTSGFDNYYHAYLRKADSCGDASVSFPVPERTTSTCSLTCADCEALPDSLKTGLREYCELICNNGFASPCDQSKAMMLINLSPGGQYAQFDKVMGNVDASRYPVSIFHQGKWRTLTTTAPAGLGQYINNNDLNGLVNNWKSEWAEYFLPLHPEYCYYQFCKSNEKAYILSKQFDDKMRGKTNAQKAVSSVYINPVANDPSLNLFNITVEVKAKMDNFRNGKSLKEFIYSGFQSCNSIPPYNNNFANTPDTIANNMQWQMFRALYVSIKNQVVDSLRELYVKKCGGYCNKCIGDTLNYYSSCAPPVCNIPVDSICNSLKKKFKLFPSSFSYQEQLPFKLTGVDTLDLSIIQNYTARTLPQTCKCAKHEQIESIFRYVIAKKSLATTILIPDTLCSVGTTYETLPGYKGHITWRGTAQTGGGLSVTLYDTLRKPHCVLKFISMDSVIPWRKIIQISCLRADRLPTQFSTGPNIFLVDLYDSDYKKYTAEANISCIDASSCKPAETCTRVCKENGLDNILKCGFANGRNPLTLDLKDPLIKKSVECLYNTKLDRGRLSWSGIRRGNEYVVTISVNAETVDKKKLIDSCQYIFDFGSDIVYAGSSIEVISIEPDRAHARDKCKIFGLKLILKIKVENLPPRYITVYGKPAKDCFLIEECCKKIPEKVCANEFSRSGTSGPTFSNSYPDTVSAQLGFADTIWARKFALNNSGYYYFSFTIKATVKKGIPASSLNSTILSQLIELRINDSVYTPNLVIQSNGNNEYSIGGRIPFKYRKTHRLQVELKQGGNTPRQFRILAYDFSLVGENCDDCCLPVFPPAPIPDPAVCDSTRVIVDGHNGQIIKSQYLAELRSKLKLEYIQHCMSNIDSFRLKYSDALYHFTLYYYDQANNLQATIAPNGVHLLSPDSVKKVQLHRQNAASPAIYPDHAFKSTYRYNSINSVMAITSPDAGTSHNWYDLLGRLVVRQQARQVSAGKFNYILYDHLSRIVQSGEFVKQAANIPSLIGDPALFLSTLRSSERHEVNSVVYDQPFVDSINGLTSVYRKKKNYFSDSLNYLRHRVAATFLIDTIPAGTRILPETYRHAIHYWYDMHGYVKLMIHEIPELRSYGQDLKSIGYDYELISGEVRKTKYQQGEADQFYTLYKYDGDKKLRQVQTSLNDSLWDNDASYYYNKHGVLARSELGEDHVQGVDYVYTIQGWLKTINSIALQSSDDPGTDGDSQGIHQRFARDGYGFEIGYFKNDYTPINAALNSVTFHNTIYDSLTTLDGLYNGNIRHTVKKLNVPQVNNNIQAIVYSYDQLNRLIASRVDTVLLPQVNLLTTTSVPDYGMKISYDANGNILSLLRNGTTASANKLSMDALAYHYNAGNNQLQYTTDTVNAVNYNNDIDGSQPNNYVYDASGNLTKDRAEKLDTILWTPMGKIQGIVKDTGRVQIDFAYNTLGYRSRKTSGDRSTYYISDMDGHVFATYVKDPAGLRCNTHTILGSKRLGIYNPDTSDQYSVFARGSKQYELTDNLGNVLLTISNRSIANDPDSNGIINYYSAHVVSATDYYPFGMEMPGRTLSTSIYQYGYNGKEKDDEVDGSGNYVDFGSRIYNSRIGRFLTVDPLTIDYPSQSTYSVSRNNPVLYVDEDGAANNWPSVNVSVALIVNHPINTAALVGSNNTSPNELYKFVKRDPMDPAQPGAFYKLKGAFGEAETYSRLMTDYEITAEAFWHPAPNTQFGAKYKAAQVDIQSRINMERSYEVGIRSYSFEGKELDLALEGQHPGLVIINYEVKTLSPKNRVKDNYDYFLTGIEQTIYRSKGDNVVGVLVTDKEAWEKVAADPHYGPKLRKEYNRMRTAGGYLRLEEKLSEKTEKNLWKTYKTVDEVVE